MYIPRNLRMDEKQCRRLIVEHPFAVMISAAPMQATHLPMELDDEGNSLLCHLARANAHWQDLDQKDVLVIFNGPHAYISPGMYASGPAVPTWNYVAVHVQARAQVLPIEENKAITEHMLSRYEPDYSSQDDVYDEAYVEKLNRAIVSLRLDIISMEGKLKLGQQRSTQDQQGVIQALKEGDLEARQLAEFMQQWALGCGK